MSNHKDEFIKLAKEAADRYLHAFKNLPGHPLQPVILERDQLYRYLVGAYEAGLCKGLGLGEATPAKVEIDDIPPSKLSINKDAMS